MHAGFSQAAFAAALADDLDGEDDSTHPHVPHTPELRDSFGNTASDLGTRLWGQAFIPLGQTQARAALPAFRTREHARVRSTWDAAVNSCR